jgi:hypothetical protein
MQSPECHGTWDDDIPLALEGSIEQHGKTYDFALKERWDAHTVDTVSICTFPGSSNQVTIPKKIQLPAGSRQYRIPAKDAATVDLVAPPPMKAKVSYRVSLRPTDDSLQVLRTMLDACPLTRDLRERATAANTKGEPRVVCDVAETLFDPGTQTIQLKYGNTGCATLGGYIQELSNAAGRARTDAIEQAADHGDLDSESYVRGIEEAEFREGVRLRVTAVDECGRQWGCSNEKLEAWQTTEDFDAYYAGLKAKHPEHPAFYAERWTDKYESKYNAKHPR